MIFFALKALLSHIFLQVTADVMTVMTVMSDKSTLLAYPSKVYLSLYKTN